MVDAHRFIAILDEGRERLDLIGLLLAEAHKRRDFAETGARGAGDGRGDVGSPDLMDISELMDHQKQLEQRFEGLMQRRRELRGAGTKSKALANKSKSLANEREIKEVLGLLQQATMNLTTHLKEQPSLAGNLSKLQRDRSSLAGALEQTVAELRGGGSYARLVEFISTRVAQQRVLEETRRMQERNAEALDMLAQEIHVEEEAFQRGLEERNAELARLTAHMKHLKKVTASQLRYEEASARAQLEATQRVQEQQLQRVQGEIAETEAALEREAAVNARNSSFLESQKRLLERLREDWEEKSATDVAARDKMVQDLTELRTAQRARLVALAARWGEEQEEKRERLEEVKRRTIEADAEAALAERMDRAQRLIRFHWRVYLRKKEAERKRKKKKKARSKKSDKGGTLASRLR